LKSIEHTLRNGLLISLLTMCAILWWFSSTVIKDLAEEFIYSRLTHDSEGILSAIQIDINGDTTITNASINSEYDRVFSGHYYLVTQGDGERIYSRSVWDTNLASKPVPLGSVEKWKALGPAGQELLIQATSYKKHQREYTILVAEDLTPIKASLARFHLAFAIMMVITLVLLSYIQHRQLRRSFSTLKPVFEDIKQLERGEKEQLTEDVPAEVQPLVREVNHLISKSNQRLKRSRNALGNLAHALKTPLNIIMSLAEKSEHLPQEFRDDLKTSSTDIRVIIERELKRARLAGSGSASHRFDPNEDLTGLVEVLKRIYEGKHLEFTLEYPSQGIVARLDRDDMMELLGNLLDNACKWARKAVGVEVREAEGDYIEFVVEDDGPGLDSVEQSRVLKRGTRLDENKEGHGLGMSIISEIVDIYSGVFHMSKSARFGGLSTQIRIPLADVASG